MFNPDPPPLGEVALVDWIRRQFERLGDLSRYVVVPVLDAAPAVPQQNALVIADGTNWNPGAGRGLYFWTGAAWEKL